MKKPKKHKFSTGGILFNTKHRHTGHATVTGTSYDHVHKRLHPLKPQHPHHKQPHHVAASHKHTHVVKRSSTGMHQHRAAATVRTLHESKTDIAAKRIATMKARGEKIGFARLSSAQRSDYAKKAAATRKSEGIKPFGNQTHTQRVASARKASITRRNTESAAQRHISAVRAAATRRAEHKR